MQGTSRACNANMDGRDIVCIMPTGAPHNNTYIFFLIKIRWREVVDLPATSLANSWLYTCHFTTYIVDDGSSTTLGRGRQYVIANWVRPTSLTCATVEAKMITGATSKLEKNRIIESLKMLADRRIGANDRELKLIYVTVNDVLPLDLKCY